MPRWADHARCAAASIKIMPALRGHSGSWTVRRMAYTEEENPRHEACIIGGDGTMISASRDVPFLRFARLEPSPAEYLRGLLTAIEANGGKKPHMLSIDSQSALAKLQSVLTPAGVKVGYYPPPSGEELSTMGPPPGAAAPSPRARPSRGAA